MRNTLASVSIHPTATIDVRELLDIGHDSSIGRDCDLEGRWVSIGSHFWMDRFAHIGGGSCFDVHSKLTAGNFLHMGRFSHINTAREVTIGDEVGIGIGTKVFTHGAYLSALDGFPFKFAPVVIGSRVWLPNCIVSPGVTIGDDVVVLPNSVVTRDIPSGSLAGGTPAKVITKAFPRNLSLDERREVVTQIAMESFEITEHSKRDYSEVEANQFRRYGVRCSAL